MKRVTRNTLIAVAAASGAMAMVPAAHADSTAEGNLAGSPGVASGNGIQLPVAVPVNVCGNSVNVVGLLNPAFGNTCANKGGTGKEGSGKGGSGTDASGTSGSGKGGSSNAGGGASAGQTNEGSPGVISGNGVQLPVDLPVNVSGNTANVVGIGNPVFGNESSNTSGGKPQQPGTPQTPDQPIDRSVPPVHAQPPAPHHHTAPVRPPAEEVGTSSALAETGTDGALPAALASGALLLGGAALYRRHRVGARH
ncbi:chaplin [Streptomyces sp. NPDC028635]|uniref:chaplin n=1 Tax=Streptomyces sp. NPDC028635 TaxID=3154800 RepID=UPI0033CEA83A